MPTFCVPLKVRIGRTLQSFPPSKRSGRLSTHSAFQRTGLRPLCFTGTLPPPWGRLSLTGSPLSTSPRCGLVRPLRSLTRGGPAPWPRHDHAACGSDAAALPPAPGPFRGRPRREAGWECPSATARDASHPERPPRRRADGEQRLPTCGRDRPAALPLWRWGVSATLPPARVPTLPTAVPGVRIGCRPRAVRHPWLGHGRPVLPRLRPPLVANHGRPRHRPHTVVHVWCSERTISCAVKGRTRTLPVSSGP
jgi:hypothetical protein